MRPRFRQLQLSPRAVHILRQPVQRDLPRRTRLHQPPGFIKGFLAAIQPAPRRRDHIVGLVNRQVLAIDSLAENG